MKPDKIHLSLALLIILTFFSWFTSCTHVANIANIPEICFTADVLPIFINNCAISGCHDGGGRESRMTLNNYADISRTITAGNPNASRSYQAIIAKSGENMMPPRQPLSLTDRTIIRVWIEQGAIESSAACPTTGNGGNTPLVARACFTRDILPVILSRCATTGCHDANAGSELSSFTTYANIKSSVSPGNPSQSRLYTVINHSSGESKMPPASSPQLTVAEIDSIGKWISYGALNETCGEVCDTLNPVTFSGTIWPIMQTSCTGCHTGTSAGGGIVLANYTNVQASAANGSLMNSLRGNGVSLMPKGSSFSVCRIRQFDMWVKAGYLNN
jgi:mono/diheme cytochrome c family protein